MNRFVGSLLIVCVVALNVNADDRQEELFASWQEAKRDVKSLVVEFTREVKNRDFNTSEKREGTLRLIRTPQGDLFVSCEIGHHNVKTGKRERVIGLLNHGSIYFLIPDEKTAFTFEPSDGNVVRFLETRLSPFIRLLDRKSAEEDCMLTISKQDENYTYLQMKSKPHSVSTSDDIEGRIVLMNKSSKAIPKDMPRQLWHIDGSDEITWDIKSWKLNPAEPPKLEEFNKPEDRPGWTVGDWPFWGGKKKGNK